MAMTFNSSSRNATNPLRGFFMRHKAGDDVGFSWDAQDPRFPADQWERIAATPEHTPVEHNVDTVALSMLHAVFRRPDVSVETRDDFVNRMVSGEEELILGFNDFREMARVALTRPELDLPAARAEWNAWYFDPDGQGGKTFAYQGTREGIHNAFAAKSEEAWLECASRRVAPAAAPATPTADKLNTTALLAAVNLISGNFENTVMPPKVDAVVRALMAMATSTGSGTTAGSAAADRGQVPADEREAFLRVCEALGIEATACSYLDAAQLMTELRALRASTVANRGQSPTLQAHQLKQALQLAWPDGDADPEQGFTRVTLVELPAGLASNEDGAAVEMPAGLYLSFNDMPSEGWQHLPEQPDPRGGAAEQRAIQPGDAA